MLKIRELEFERNIDGKSYCQLFGLYNLLIESDGIHFNAYFCRLVPSDNKVSIGHSFKSYVEAKKACRQFLKDLFKNVTEI